ncbi:aspartate ammonia-lyase [Rhizobium leguminosarum]|uniref:aspartate ammonia-lyase n=1 Tax=Rhizobium TaxID=379 RepID=UPI00160F6281|nr:MULTISPECIES: aspartate ammonia-lyase [Rhizobium]MBB4299427.1 aspartate ammonia-lyase [Rhizobium leguminosarum]MBB4436422.1 aspartate ammonia-lyase [Rhizobium esperanzae]MBB5683736.1 aspartate ammonia-lyase [Rhizobium leguminosarum]MBB6267712.1 aspartate ammonia-lyase [Rhizobium leguminosarum]
MNDKQPTIRIEQDSLGEIEILAEPYFGPQTARAVANFPISGVPISHFPVFIQALGYVKKAAAIANRDLGELEVTKATSIIAACDELIAGELIEHFPIDVFQGGAGTSVNMNANEVIANRALELEGYSRGRYDIIHPNNHVNVSQSTNDVYPTAIRLAILLSYGQLRDALKSLAEEFERKGNDFHMVIKLGRTQLQDAVPMTLGQEFRAFAATILDDVERLDEMARFFKKINLGGTAIGTGINTVPGYQDRAVKCLSQVTGIAFQSARNLVEASWDTGSFVLFSGMLKRTATKLSKICNDLRLLSSGPRGGLNEINLPPMQPGSSIMPGKINPVIPEVVNQVAFQVIGADLTITLAAEAGQLQLNVMEPVIAYNMLQSIGLMTNAVGVLQTKCIAGITANEAVCKRHLEQSTAVATALSPMIGYEQAAQLAKSVLSSGKTIREVLAEDPGLSEELIEFTADMHALTMPMRRELSN